MTFLSGQGPSDWWSVGPVDFVILGLATWRLTSLLVNEEGPWDIFARLRRKLGVRYNERSVAYGTNLWSDLLLCTWCASVWTGASISLAYLISRPIAVTLCFPLALSSVAMLMDRMVSHE